MSREPPPSATSPFFPSIPSVPGTVPSPRNTTLRTQSGAGDVAAGWWRAAPVAGSVEDTQANGRLPCRAHLVFEEEVRVRPTP